MRLFIGCYLAAAIIMAGIDAIWLTLTAGPLYRAQLGPLLMPGFSPLPAILFYAIYVVGIVVLVVIPSVHSGDWQIAAIKGALLGLCAYATYDLTNQATLRGWSGIVTVADLAWGTVLTSVTSASVTAIVMAIRAR